MLSSGVGLGLNWGAWALQRWGPGGYLDPHMAFNFAVEIEGLLVGGFSQVSGLASEIETEEYREGGVNDFVHHFPAQTTHSNVLLTHGLTDSSVLWNWYSNVTQGIIHRKNGTIVLLDRQQMPVMWWNFRNAYPVRWSGPDFDAGAADGVAIEVVELVHEGFSKPLLGQGLAFGRGVARRAGWQGGSSFR